MLSSGIESTWNIIKKYLQWWLKTWAMSVVISNSSWLSDINVFHRISSVWAIQRTLDKHLPSELGVVSQLNSHTWRYFIFSSHPYARRGAFLLFHYFIHWFQLLLYFLFPLAAPRSEKSPTLNRLLDILLGFFRRNWDSSVIVKYLFAIHCGSFWDSSNFFKSNSASCRFFEILKILSKLFWIRIRSYFGIHLWFCQIPVIILWIRWQVMG